MSDTIRLVIKEKEMGGKGMKKKLLALATVVFMIFSFAGCSAEGTALLKEMEKVCAWEATEQTGTMNFEVAAGESTIKFDLDYTAYTIPETLQMDMTVNAKSCSVDDKTFDLTKGTYKLSPIKMYMDGLKMYISSTFIKEVCGIAGEDATEVMDLSKDYIAYDMTDTYAQMGIDVKKLAKDSVNMSKELFSELEKAGIAVAVKQEGRKYTVELSAEEMIKAGIKLYAKSFEMQKDTLTKTYKQAGLTDEQIKEVMTQVQAVGSDEMVATYKEMFNGSTAKYVVEYTDDTQKTEMTFDMKVNVEEEKVAVKFTMTDHAKKAAKKEIKMPTSVKAYTMDDIMNLAAAQAETAVEEAAVEEAETPQADTKDANAATKAAA